MTIHSPLITPENATPPVPAEPLHLALLLSPATTDRSGTGPPLVAYDFSIDRSKRRPLGYLNDYKGYVHADAYSGYDELFRKEEIIEVGCWAHARRKFDEAATSRPKEATDVLARIARLYHEVETPCADMTPEERRLFRQEHAAPLLAIK